MHHKYTHVIGCAGIILPCLGIEMFDFFPLQKRAARGKVKQLVSLMLSNPTPSNLKLLPNTKFAVNTGCTGNQNPWDAALPMTVRQPDA
jgi:hypothetical protein